MGMPGLRLLPKRLVVTVRAMSELVRDARAVGAT
jgi:hypothetical protein